MSSRLPFAKRYSELPQSLPLFVLPKAVLLPGGFLPLNIFEPRYLNMVRDAMRSHQLIGMIQPSANNASSQQTTGHPQLFSVGCAGHLIKYQETADGRLEIVLAGLCRFALSEDSLSDGGYRVGQVNWQSYAQDYDPLVCHDSDLENGFRGVLRDYMQKQELKTDWTTLDKLNCAELANNMISYLPLSADDKQLILETLHSNDRIKVFTAVLKQRIASSTSTPH